MSEKKSILLVEDDPNDIELFLRVLREYNDTAETVVVRDGVEALDYLFAKGAYAERDASDLPTVILLDFKLPKITGLEVLQSLRLDDRTKLIPVVILTSSEQEQDLINSYAGGANSYVCKPVDYSQFTETIRQLGYYWLNVNRYPSDTGRSNYG